MAIEPKKAKRKINEDLWSISLGCKVKVLKAGHFPDTLLVKLEDGKEVEVDMAYLTNLK